MKAKNLKKSHLNELNASSIVHCPTKGLSRCAEVQINSHFQTHQFAREKIHDHFSSETASAAAAQSFPVKPVVGRSKFGPACRLAAASEPPE